MSQANRVIKIRNKDLEILYSLFRDHEDLVGASRTAILALEAFAESIKELKCDKNDLRRQIFDLSKVIKNSEPKIIPLIHLIEQFEEEMAKENNYDKKSLEEIKKQARWILKKKITEFNFNIDKIVDNSRQIIQNKDVIIIHAVSTPLIRILLDAKKDKKKFKVLLLKQDFIKTKQIIEMLQENQIEHDVVPEYNVSHLMDEVTKLFLGATSVTCDGMVVAAVGTSNIVSICHMHKIPIYLFVNTSKFSHCGCLEQGIHKKSVKKSHDDVKYSLVSYSHDTFNVALVNHLITENGEEDYQKICKV